MPTDNPLTEADHRISLGVLRERLSAFPDDAEVTFGAIIEAVPLIFYRVKDRGRNPQTGRRIVQIELNEFDQYHKKTQ